MRHLFLFLLLFASCSEKKNQSAENQTNTTTSEVFEASFQHILDSARLKGSILVFSEKDSLFHSNNFQWANKGQLPASTFKIPNSIVALETGVVESDSSIFIWNGEDRGMTTWEEDLTLRQAFLRSCVPCYQEVARKVGAARMSSWISKLGYGEIIMDSSNLDMFWLEGESRISQFQQIDFLRRLAASKLPISDRTESLIKKIMVLESNESYTVRGKTGWSIVGDQNNGWFVGYMNTQKDRYFFATNVEPKDDFDMSNFARIRMEVTMNAFDSLGILKR